MRYAYVYMEAAKRLGEATEPSLRAARPEWSCHLIACRREYMYAAKRLGERAGNSIDSCGSTSVAATTASDTAAPGLAPFPNAEVQTPQRRSRAQGGAASSSGPHRKRGRGSSLPPSAPPPGSKKQAQPTTLQRSQAVCSDRRSRQRCSALRLNTAACQTD